ncbi:MAG: hypothetical protein IKR52_04265 [Paludibacteraceae bacterium]|nr:hypothetical protein [Paludibacteraceae bacterium]
MSIGYDNGFQIIEGPVNGHSASKCETNQYVFQQQPYDPATVSVTVTDGDKTYTSTADFVVIDPFDFSASVFDSSIWKTDTYDETTCTFGNAN